VACSYTDPDSQTGVSWTERRLVVQSEAHALRQRTALSERLRKAESALRALQPAPERAKLEAQVATLLTRYAVGDYLDISYHARVESRTQYVGRGRPGPKRATQTLESHSWLLKTRRRRAALNRFNRLAGWRLYATNTSAERLSLSAAVNC
jgi:hypothetical protein